MPRDPLIRAWIGLMALGAATTAASLGIGRGWDTGIGLLILALAVLKARIVLSRYLGLSEAPAWGRGFESVLMAFLALLAGLYLIPAA